jgi:AI-2 transport protein TqsA
MDEQADRRIQTICLLVLTGVAAGVALYYLRAVLVPFILAFFIAFILSPVMDLQIRWLRMPRGVAVVVTILFALLILALAGLVVSMSVSQMVENRGLYEKSIEELDQELTGWVPFEWMKEQAAPRVDEAQERLAGLIGRLIDSILGLLGNAVLVLIFVLFMLAGHRARAQPKEGVWGDVERSIKNYLVTKVTVSLATDVLVALLLRILGVPMALAFGLLSFMLNFIPNIGSVIATILPLPVVLVSPELGATSKIIAVAGPAVINFALGNLVEPKMMGASVDLHPVTILLALVFWGMLWGIPGMLLAVPMTASLKILFEKLDLTRPVANLLAGRPAEPAK